jgi:uncharacterized membrane protein
VRRSPAIALVAAIGVALLHAWHLSSVLPERVASHFDGAGLPNGWTTRAAFVGVYLGVIAVVSVSFGGIAALVRRVPSSLINLPNKAYWLAPDRREATMGWITGWSCLFGAATLLLMMALMRQAELVNLGAAQRINGVTLVGSYVALSVGMLIVTIVKFAKKPPA